MALVENRETILGSWVCAAAIRQVHQGQITSKEAIRAHYHERRERYLPAFRELGSAGKKGSRRKYHRISHSRAELRFPQGDNHRWPSTKASLHILIRPRTFGSRNPGYTNADESSVDLFDVRSFSRLAFPQCTTASSTHFSLPEMRPTKVLVLQEAISSAVFGAPNENP